MKNLEINKSIYKHLIQKKCAKICNKACCCNISKKILYKDNITIQDIYNLDHCKSFERI